MVTPYLVFAGNCATALEFYRQVFESAPAMCRFYGDYTPPSAQNPPVGLRDWVLHAEMEICGTKFWFADVLDFTGTGGGPVRLTATVPTADEAYRIFEALRDQGAVSLPPTQTFYSAFHAALTDKFGIGWNLVAEQAPDPILS